MFRWRTEGGTMIGRTRRTRTVIAATLVATTGGALLATQGAGVGPPRTMAAAAASASPARNGPPVLPLPRPRDFVRVVDNPYLPWKPGTRWVYVGRGAAKGERTLVTVLHKHKRIEGIRATVVHDTVSEGGQLVEDTFDWYGQDKVGNVWSRGENTKEFENGHVVSTGGSWEAGVNGGHGGIAMPGQPVLDRRYRQEFDAGNAEDEARVIMVGG